MEEPFILVRGSRKPEYYEARIDQRRLTFGADHGKKKIDPRMTATYGVPITLRFGHGYTWEGNLGKSNHDVALLELGRALEGMKAIALEERVDGVLLDNFTSQDNGTGWKIVLTYQMLLFR